MELGTPASAGQVTMLDQDGPNSIAVALGIVGDEWTLWIVEMALQGVTRYGEWLRAGPISSAVLTARLARLVEAGVVERTPRASDGGRPDYQPTERARQMWPILLTMWSWEQVWVDDPSEHLPQMRHTTCDAVFRPVLLCDACDEPAVAHDVAGRFGPSGGWPRSVPVAATRRRQHSGHRPVELVDQTMALIGNRWSAALLGAAFMGAQRFGEFEQSMGAPPKIVAERLRTFTELGVLASSPNPQRPDWVVYQLTDKGRAFFPVMASIFEWGQRWFRSPDGVALRLTHSGCGRAFHPRLRCSECRERLRGRTVAIVRTAESVQAATFTG
jgi:DNA-binding HxlR family transcriptional regulator